MTSSTANATANNSMHSGSSAATTSSPAISSYQVNSEDEGDDEFPLNGSDSICNSASLDDSDGGSALRRSISIGSNVNSNSKRGSNNIYDVVVDDEDDDEDRDYFDTVSRKPVTRVKLGDSNRSGSYNSRSRSSNSSLNDSTMTRSAFLG